jgi:3-hydroxy acid dehydrogenase/malonic semialdehyde reductase
LALQVVQDYIHINRRGIGVKNRQKYALVTGGTTGIGAAISQKLVEKGYFVITASKNAEERQRDYVSHAITLDLQNHSSLRECVKQVTHLSEGHLDLLVNCSGIGYECPIENESEENVRQVLDINLLGTILLTNQLIPSLEKASGTIIFISSIAGFKGFALWTTYCASKFGLEGYASALREEIRSRSIRVSVIRPGSVDTPFYASKSFDERTHFMSPQTVANSVLLCVTSEDSASFEEIFINNRIGDL